MRDPRASMLSGLINEQSMWNVMCTTTRHARQIVETKMKMKIDKPVRPPAPVDSSSNSPSDPPPIEAPVSPITESPPVPPSELQTDIDDSISEPEICSKRSR